MEKFSLGLREYFKYKEGSGDDVTALTFSANLKAGGLTLYS
jgi:hypothetical protein